MQQQYQAHFPAVHIHFTKGKIKKIIQSNQEVGKLAHPIPHLMEHSLQIFLNNVLDSVNEIAIEEDYSKVTPSVLKSGLIKSKKYDFLLPFLNEVEEENAPKRKKMDSQNNKGRKKKKLNDDE